MASKRFKKPTTAQILAAVGLREEQNQSAGATKYDILHEDVYPKKMVPDTLRKALLSDDSLFEKLPKPGPDDWLSCHPEAGQSFSHFIRSRRNSPDSRRKTIYILPVTFFENDVPADVASDLTEFASIFFGMPVKMMKSHANLKDSVPNRINEYTGKIQVHAGVVLDTMKKLIPSDAFCLGALTLCDLYPRESWNFVFGIASLHNRVGVYSLARFMPGFPEEETDTSALTREQRTTLLLSSCKLMCHEMCHMFGMTHCIYYHCLMNGSNNFEESFAKPLHLCPVCLRKLQHSCGFDVLYRYEQLLQWCNEKGLGPQKEWLENRISTIKG